MSEAMDGRRQAHRDVLVAVPENRPRAGSYSQSHAPKSRKPHTKAGFSVKHYKSNNQLSSLIITPAATAEPITPATFGPIACISRKFCGFASRPTLLETRAAIGTADTPAEPINGLIGSLLNLFISLAIRTPQAVPTPNATIPSPRIPRV